MNRRQFLESLAAGVIIATAPLIDIEPTQELDAPDFDVDAEYGKAIYFTSKDACDSGLDYAKNLLIRDAKHFLPMTSIFEIRRSVPLDFGRRHGLAWYYHPKLPADLVEHDPPLLDPMGGFYLMVRDVV